MYPARRQELKQLVEICALRTRMLSDSIAILGAHVASGKQIGEIMVEIRKLRGLVEEAATNLFAFVSSRPEDPAN